MDSNLPAAVCALGLVRNFVCRAHWAGYGGHSHFPVKTLATREGFEPPTCGFGDRRSASWNYRVMNIHIEAHSRL